MKRENQKLRARPSQVRIEAGANALDHCARRTAERVRPVDNL